MRVTVVGTGYVGLTAGLCFADFGNDVVCMDTNQDKIDRLSRGECPIYEPGMESLIERNIESGRIRFTSDPEYSIKHGEIIFIGVGTPESENGEADLSAVFRVAECIGKYMDSDKIIVDKSTVPVGTSRKVAEIVSAQIKSRNVHYEFDVASNPEFLREGRAIGDFTNPDRIVLGMNTEFARKKLLLLYSVFNRSNKPIIVTTPETAEMIKYASNAYLATKITFINEMANLCEKVGANVLDVAKAMGLDGRISPKFLHAGPGYGGSCFPKDTKALVDIGQKYGAPVTIVENVIKANEHQKKIAASKIIKAMPKGGTVCILGLSFKPETDDIRESPAITIIRELVKNEIYKVVLYDPQAMENMKKELEEIEYDKLTWKNNVYDAIRGADAVAVVTEWSEFRGLDFSKVKQEMNGNLIFDFRNVYTKKDLAEAGLVHIGTGV